MPRPVGDIEYKSEVHVFSLFTMRCCSAQVAATPGGGIPLESPLLNGSAHQLPREFMQPSPLFVLSELHPSNPSFVERVS